jgi:hypothetical protein
VVPFWFASVALYQGRYLLALAMFLVYAASSAYPLRFAYIVRLRS